MNTSGFCHITIKDKQVGLLFGLPAIAQIGEKEKIVPFYQDTLQDGVITKTFSMFGIQQIMYAGYCNNCQARALPIELSDMDFYNLVEDCISKPELVISQLKPVIECFENSRYVKPLVDAAQPQETKKKSLAGKK